MPLVLIDAFPQKANNQMTHTTPHQSNDNILTRRLKEVISNQVLLTGIDELPPIRWLANHLNVSKSCISRKILELADDNWLIKQSWGKNPRQSHYIITVTPQKCSDFINDYYLSRQKMKDFKKLKRVGTVKSRGTVKKVISIRRKEGTEVKFVANR